MWKIIDAVDTYTHQNGCPDIYFEEHYGRLYEKYQRGKLEVFNYTCQYGSIKHQFIKREIPMSLEDDIIYFDLVTPYGYGGPVITAVLAGKKQELVQRFYYAFKAYCKVNNVVSEFVRFHPIVNNARDFEAVYNGKCIRNTLGTNLKDYDDVVQSEFSKKCRRNIRKALRHGVTYRVIEAPGDMQSFKHIYYATMDRNHASHFYYFDNAYFENCLKYFREHIVVVEALFEGEIIASEFDFVSNNVIHSHLAGTLNQYMYLSPSYILAYAITEWGKERGYDVIHHGGGRSNSTEDLLYKFKKQFAKNTEFEFWTGRKIWHEAHYDQLCQKANVHRDIEFFPAYRYEREDG